MLSNKFTLRIYLTKQHPFSLWSNIMEKKLSKICVRFYVHTEASAIDFRENYGYCEHLNSKKDASNIFMQLTIDLQIESQNPVMHTEPKRNQTRIVFLDIVFSYHILHRRLPSFFILVSQAPPLFLYKQ